MHDGNQKKLCGTGSAHLFALLVSRNVTRKVKGLDGIAHKFRWRNGIELNKSNRDLTVNLLEYWKRKPESAIRKRGGSIRQ